MESLAKSDIFFFVTTICVLVITGLLAMVLVHVLHIVREVRKTLDRVHTEAHGLADDFAALRAELRKNQYGLKPIFDGIQNMADKMSAKKPRAKKSKDDPPVSFS